MKTPKIRIGRKKGEKEKERKKRHFRLFYKKKFVGSQNWVHTFYFILLFYYSIFIYLFIYFFHLPVTISDWREFTQSATRVQFLLLLASKSEKKLTTAHVSKKDTLILKNNSFLKPGKAFLTVRFTSSHDLDRSWRYPTVRSDNLTLSFFWFSTLPSGERSGRPSISLEDLSRYKGI